MFLCFGQDIDVEPHFQDVMATTQRCVEEGCSRAGVALKGHFQQLHSDIVAGVNSGRKYKRAQERILSAWGFRDANNSVRVGMLS